MTKIDKDITYKMFSKEQTFASFHFEAKLHVKGSQKLSVTSCSTKRSTPKSIPVVSCSNSPLKYFSVGTLDELRSIHLVQDNVGYIEDIQKTCGLYLYN